MASIGFKQYTFWCYWWLSTTETW